MKVGIAAIDQLDNHTFQIEWTDGITDRYRLSELQATCPCAACIDEASGKRVVDPQSIPSQLTAKRVKSVGRYAIQIDFSTGCSRGIFGYDFLRKLKGRS